MADCIHCVRKTLRLMPEEAKELAEKSKSVHMNEAEYIRFLIRQKPSDYPEIRKLIKELINEVNRIGININQIAFHNNAELYSKKDKEQLMAYMQKLNHSVNEVVVKIGNQKDIAHEGLWYFFSCQTLKEVFRLCYESRKDTEWEAGWCN